MILISQEGNKIEIPDNDPLLNNPIISQFDKNENLPIPFNHLELIINPKMAHDHRKSFLSEHIKFLKIFVLEDHIKKIILDNYLCFSDSQDIHQYLSIYDMHNIREYYLDEFLNKRVSYALEDEIRKIKKIKCMRINIEAYKLGKFIDSKINFENYIGNDIITIPYVTKFISTRHFRAIKYASKDIRNNIEFMKNVCHINGRILKYASKQLKNNFEFVKIACSQNGLALKYVSKQLKNNFELVKICCSRNADALDYASRELKNDFEMIKFACLKNGLSLQYASEELRNNFEIVKIACSQNGFALKYASDELKDNFEMVKIACSQIGLF